MTNKMRETIAKLNNAKMYPNITYMYFNVYWMKSIYSSYGIIVLNKLQDNILRKIYKPIIAKKLGLGKHSWERFYI